MAWSEGVVAGLVMPTEGNFAEKLAVSMELVVSE
jgi:hypothetical protein